MKIIATILALLAGGYCVWLVTNNHPEVKSKVASILDLGNFHTLEVRYNANQIMEQHRRNLLKDHRHRFLDPVLEFYPYLLMEVKYTSADDKTRESIILWDLTDGEMVVNTKNWEKTHGFGDCIAADTTPLKF
jgi:glycerol kinase